MLVLSSESCFSSLGTASCAFLRPRDASCATFRSRFWAVLLFVRDVELCYFSSEILSCAALRAVSMALSNSISRSSRRSPSSGTFAPSHGSATTASLGWIMWWNSPRMVPGSSNYALRLTYNYGGEREVMERIWANPWNFELLCDWIK